MNVFIFMPSFLDLRYKLNLVEFSFAELHDFETAKALISNVKETLTRLFEHYHFTLLYSSRTRPLFCLSVSHTMHFGDANDEIYDIMYFYEEMSNEDLFERIFSNLKKN